jgi:molybdate transport system substrate-binding protein
LSGFAVLALALAGLGPLIAGPLAAPGNTGVSDVTPAAGTSPSGRSALPDTARLSVAAASDLRYAMDELVAAYGAVRPGTAVTVTCGSSGQLFAQIGQGAPFDLFFSADVEYPRRLEGAGLATPGSTRAYADGRLVVWVREDSPIDVERLGLAAVLDPAAARVAIANPLHAPYGRAAEAALASAGLRDAVQPRLVVGENVTQAAQFAASGAADVALIALSLAIAPPLEGRGRFALVPRTAHPAIRQGAVILDSATDPRSAADFLDLVLGPDGWSVLERYGFEPPQEG